MCWLTNPVAADVIENYHSSGPATCSQDASSSGWLAVVTRDSRTCFDLDGAGVGRALALMADAASGLCLLMRFASASPAYSWLGSDATGDVLGVLWSSTVLDTGKEPPTMQSCGSNNQGGHALSSRQPGYVGADGAPSGCEQHVVGGLSASMLDGLVPSRSAASRSGLPSSKRPPPQALLLPEHMKVGRDGGLGELPAPPAPPLRDTDAGGFIDLAPPVGVGLSSWTSPIRASPSASRCGPTVADPSTEKLVVAVSCSSAGKRRRVEPNGGSFTARNPAWTAPEPGAGTFEASNLSKMVQESSLAWKLRDLDEASKNFKAGSCSVNAPEAVTARKALAEMEAANNNVCSDTASAPPTGSCSPGNPIAEDVQGGKTGAALPPIGTISPTSSPTSSQGPTPVAEPPATQRWAEGPISVEEDAVGVTSPSPGAVPVHLPQGPIGQLAADGSWDAVYERLFQRGASTFVTGGPGVGKTHFLKQFAGFLRKRWTAPGTVVVVAPTGSAARSASGQTFHSFFGFVRDYHVQLDDPAAEAARLLKMDRWVPIARRLKEVRALLIDEISMVSADKLDVMYEMVRQTQMGAQQPCMLYAFGDFLQLPPTQGSMAFMAKCWRPVFGTAVLELTRVHRQTDHKLIGAIQDARWGHCSPKVDTLMKERAVTDERYKVLEHTVLHIMPRHEDVTEHNKKCLLRLSGGRPIAESIAKHEVVLDKNRDPSLRPCHKSNINPRAPEAALLDCVAPPRVPHCLQARVMLTTNRLDDIGLYHGSIGFVTAYLDSGVPVVRFENHPLPTGVTRGTYGVQDVGDDWVEVACPPMEYEARILSAPGWVVVRLQVPFVLGWGITAHRCQSLTMSEVVIDVARAFGAGMVHAAMSRVPTSARLHVKSFSAARLFADEACMHYYRTATLL